MCAHVLLEENQNFCIILAGITCLKLKIKILKQSVKLCSYLTRKTTERGHWCCSGTLLVNFKHVLHLILLIWLLTLACNASKNCKNFLWCCHTTTVKTINYNLLKSSINFD